MTANGPKTKININPRVNCYSKSIMAILYLSWLPLLQLGFLCHFITMQKEKFSQTRNLVLFLATFEPTTTQLSSQVPN